MSVFFFNDTATTEIYTLSLHDALPICDHAGVDLQRAAGGATHQWTRRRGAHGAAGGGAVAVRARVVRAAAAEQHAGSAAPGDRKSTRLNSSHANISYAVFCLKKKKKNK